jgi:hypothetical protein
MGMGGFKFSKRPMYFVVRGPTEWYSLSTGVPAHQPLPAVITVLMTVSKGEIAIEIRRDSHSTCYKCWPLLLDSKAPISAIVLSHMGDSWLGTLP